MDSPKILIVDDDQDIRQLLGQRLKSRGYEAVYAGDAIAAVNQARKEKPDLILLDLSMPAGDGYVVIERIKAMPALEGTPVIIVTARDPLAEEQRFIDSGADAFFRKPFDYDELLQAIGRALGS
jgi:two-component system alkaline phosphatase synthesis response regulator PhoP